MGELRSWKSYMAKRKLCDHWSDLLEVHCWNTFASWAILRDIQLDVALCLVLAIAGACGRLAGISIGLILFSHCAVWAVTGLDEETDLHSALLRRLPEALTSL